MAGAGSVTEISAAYLYRAITRFRHDSVLAPALGKLGHLDAVSMIRTLCTSGSVTEKMRMTRYLTPKQALALPGIIIESGGSGDSSAYVTITAFLNAHIQDLAQFLGADVMAPVQQLSEAIVEAYAQFSLLDFVLFFNYAKQGLYQNQYQHVAGRGLNAQFLMQWLDLYAEDRQLEIENLRKEAKNFTLSRGVATDMSEIAAKIEAAAAKRKQVQDRIKDMRGQWWQEAKTDWKLQLHLFCAWAFASNPRTAWIEIKSFVESRIQNLARFDRVSIVSVTTPDGSQNEVETKFSAESYKLSVLAPVIAAMTSKSLALGSGGLIRQVLVELIRDKAFQTPEQLWHELWPALTMPATYSGHDISKIADVIASQIQTQIERSWPRYRDDMLETEDALPVIESEFHIMQAVLWMQHVGIENPLQHDLVTLLNKQQ